MNDREQKLERKYNGHFDIDGIQPEGGLAGYELRCEKCGPLDFIGSDITSLIPFEKVQKSFDKPSGLHMTTCPGHIVNIYTVYADGQRCIIG